MGSGIASSSILADELHKPIIRKFNKRKVYSQFKDNIWGVDLGDMSSVKWTVLAHLESYGVGKIFKPKSSGPFLPTLF